VGTRALAGVAAVGLLLACGTKTRQDLGGACASDLDCRVGLMCIGDDPGGQCTKTCAGDGDCGNGALCNTESKCYIACNASADCPRAASDPRYGCTGDPPRRFCDVLPTDDGGAHD
jgi:hypothetical protein